jgi:hypothetical protein
MPSQMDGPSNGAVERQQITHNARQKDSQLSAPTGLLDRAHASRFWLPHYSFDLRKFSIVLIVLTVSRCSMPNFSSRIASTCLYNSSASYNLPCRT